MDDMGVNVRAEAAEVNHESEDKVGRRMRIMRRSLT